MSRHTASLWAYLLFSLQLFTFTSAQATVHGGDDGWHLDTIYQLVNERLDPIVNPNDVSAHMHKVIGGSMFGSNYNYKDYSKAKCSSCKVQADKSNYWKPALYMKNPADGKFYGVGAKPRFYYFAARTTSVEVVKPFPKGLRMLVGSPENRSPSNLQAFSCQNQPDMSNTLYQDNFNFNRDCPYGMKTEIFFPQCWNGKDLYISDGSHMAYPIGNLRDGWCPVSHPVRLPTIQLEYTWFTSSVAKGVPLAGNLYWANGDTTGYGLHADFINGWDMNVLRSALNSTACGIGGGYAVTFEQCPIFAASMDDNAAKNCRPERGQLQEPSGNADYTPLSYLPGCQPMNGTMLCPQYNRNADNLAGLTGTDGSLIADDDDRGDFTLPTVPGWTNILCAREIGAIAGGPNYTDANLTVSSCQSTCAKGGFNFASVGQTGIGTWNCVCGSSLNYGAALQPGLCTAPCPGNSTQKCGGNGYIFSISYAPAGTVTPDIDTHANGALALGCYNSKSLDSGLIGSSLYSFNTASMTNSMCMEGCSQHGYNWAMTYSGRYCYCGNAWNITPGSWVPSDQCTVACYGNKTENCGDYYKGNVFNVTGTALSVDDMGRPAGYQGCYAQPSNGQIALANTSFSYSGMIPSVCINGCSELGYKLAGVKNLQDCMCGDVFNGGQKLPTNQCNLACKGNSSQVCGNYWNIDLYNTTSATISKASVTAAKGSSYVGCFLDSASSPALSGTTYSYTSNGMTPSICAAACQQFKYTWSGLTNGNTCKCGNVAPSISPVVGNLYCNSNCAGTSNSTCGGPGYTELYSSSSSSNSTGGTTVVASNYAGCFDSTFKNASAYNFANPNNSLDLCAQTCQSYGYPLAGSSNNYCYCGYTLNNAKIYPESSCTTACPGNSKATCGGPNFFSVYNISIPQASSTDAASKPDGWMSCWSDSSSSRALQGYTYSAGIMSGKACRVACYNQGFSYAGTENGNTCFCGNVLATGSQASTSSCSAPCAGNTKETCGGSGVASFLDVYSTKGISVTNGIPGYTGCFTDDTKLTGYSFVSDWMSVDLCNTQCKARNFAYGGVRTGQQCKCGNDTPVLNTAGSACSAMPCPANSTQWCGSNTAVSVYSVANSYTADFPMKVNSTGYAGCWKEGNVNRLLKSASLSNAKMTNAMCVSNCRALGYAYAGTVGGNGCTCGAAPDPLSGGYPVANGNCATACAGGSGICGGSSLVSIWSTSASNFTDSSVPTSEGLQGCYAPGTFTSAAPFTYYSGAMTTSLCRRTCRGLSYQWAGLINSNICGCGNDTVVGSAIAPASCAANCAGNSTETCGGQYYGAVSLYDTTGAGSLAPAGYPANYVGCFADQASPRLLPNGSTTNSGMSSALCQKTCLAAGYPIYGTESGNQCYCGASMPRSGGALPDAQCTSWCPGASGERCGGGYRISVYKSDVQPEVKAAQASGAAINVSASSASSSAPVSASSTAGSSSTPPKSSSTSTTPASSSASPTTPSSSSSAGAASPAAAKPSSSSASPAAAAPVASKRDVHAQEGIKHKHGRKRFGGSVMRNRNHHHN